MKTKFKKCKVCQDMQDPKYLSEKSVCKLCLDLGITESLRKPREKRKRGENADTGDCIRNTGTINSIYC